MATCPSGHDSASDDFCDICGLSIGAPPLSSVDPGPGGAVPATGLSATIAGRGAVPAAGAACPRCGTARTGQFCEDCGYNFADGAAPDGTASDRTASNGPPPAQYAPPQYVPAPPAYPETAAPPVPPAYPEAAAPPVPPPRSVPGPGQAGGPGESAGIVRGKGTAQPAGTWSAVVSADHDYYESVLGASGPEAAGIGFPAYCPERRFRLSGGEVRIGRRSASRGIDPEIDLTGPPSDPGVSRLHAVLIAAPDGSWSVLDPGSANGTLVNGAEIPANQAVPLRDGDRINLGAWTLVTISRD